MPQYISQQTRTGVTNELFISLIISIFIFGLTFFLGSKKLMILSSPLVKLKAEYQMESAIIMYYNNLRSSEKGQKEMLFKSFKQELAPGVVLSFQGKKLSDSECYAKTCVQGQGWEKSLEGRLVKTAASKFAAQSSIDTVSELETSWTLEFLLVQP